MNFLEFKIREAWPKLFVPVLRAATPPTPPSDEDLFIAFQILQTILGELRRESLALTDIVDKLYNENLLRETDDMRSHANQLVFAALGWISEFCLILPFDPLTVNIKQPLNNKQAPYILPDMTLMP